MLSFFLQFYKILNGMRIFKKDENYFIGGNIIENMPSISLLQWSPNLFLKTYPIPIWWNYFRKKFFYLNKKNFPTSAKS